MVCARRDDLETWVELGQTRIFLYENLNAYEFFLIARNFKHFTTTFVIVVAFFIYALLWFIEAL